MAVIPSTFGPKPQFANAAGDPDLSYKLFFYIAGSNTKQDTFTDSTGASANANPIILNILGQPPNEIWFTNRLAYKAVLAPSTDTDPPTSPVWTIDNLFGINDTSNSTLANEWVRNSQPGTNFAADNFDLAGNQTAIFQVGRRIKAVTSAGPTVYGTILSSVFGSLTHVVVNLDSGSLASGISELYYGLLAPIGPSLPTSQAVTALIGFLQAGTGAVVRIEQDKTREILSVTDFGATLDGVADDTAEYQAALTAGAGRTVWHPKGTALVSAVLIALTNTQLVGESRNESIILRTSAHSGHTLVMGADVAGQHAGAISVRNLQFHRDIKFNPGNTSYVAGTSTSVVDRLGAQAHLYVHEAARGVIENCTFDYMPYLVVLSGGSNIRLSNNDLVGSIHDQLTANLQEGQAQLWLKRTAAGVAPTLIASRDNYYAGGFASVARNVTVGVVVSSIVENIGSKFGVLMDAAEGFTSIGDYYGGHNTHSAYVQPVTGAACSNLKWGSCFFDGARKDCINLSHADAGGATTLVSVVGCGFNGELAGERALTVEGTFSAASTFGLTFSGNVIMGSLKTPVFLWGLVGGTITGNTIGGYNALGGNAGDMTITAGVLVNGGGGGGGFSDKVFTSGNTYGGGVNNWSSSNNCQYGVYFNGTFATEVAAHGEMSAGLGLAGGALITGGSSMPVDVTVFTNAWVNAGAGFNNASYWKDADNTVHLQGRITTGTINLAAFTLPAGFRPANIVDIPTVSNGLFGHVRITAAGVMTPVVGNNAWFSLEGVTFKALQ